MGLVDLASFKDFQLSKEVIGLSFAVEGEMRIGGGDTCLTIMDDEWVPSKVEPLVNPLPFGLNTDFCGEGEHLRF